MANTKNLICRVQTGDEGAFTELMRAHYAFVYAVIIGIVNNPNDAEEIVQDTFLNAYRGLAQYEDRRKFKNWLAEIARNSVRDWLRKQRINTVSIDEVSEHTLLTPDAPDEQLIRREQRELIRRAMESLPQKDRDIARSYYLDGASYDELIRTHGLSYNAISFRLSRAKQKLAKRLSHLLTGVFVSPITSLKQIYSGGLTIMKVGTVSKFTVGATAIIGIAVIGIHQFISSKEGSPSVELVTSTSSAPTHSVTRRDAARKTVKASRRARAVVPQISTEEMEGVERFFAQLEEDLHDSEKTVQASPSEMDNEIVLDTSETEVVSESQEARFVESPRSETEAQIQTLKTEITSLLFDYEDAVNQLKVLGNQPYTDPDVVSRYIVARRETGDQIMHKSVLYQILTGDRDAIYPGGWIYELGKTVGFEIRHEDE
ncbi:MAG: sigma-70 family RNA polymerase sigma factor [Candidatus Poribacteria bacterium]|nr:sigma-70 family RNA polymerase sigma factor [Candidatus Poribacteria bacterium]